MAQDTQTLEDLDAVEELTPSDNQSLPVATSEKEEEKETSREPSGLYLFPLLILSFLNKARFLEEDGEYVRISEKLKNDYLKDHALSKKAVGLKEDVLIEEDLEYIYGQTQHPDFPTLNKDAEKIFREGLDEKNEKKREKLAEKRKKKLEKYEKEKSKIYKNPDQDPIISRLYGIVNTHASLKYLYLTKVKKQKNVEYSKIRDEIKLKAWIGFIHKYPKKATEYRNRKYAKAKCYKDLMQAYIQTWNTSQQSSRINSNIANRQADEIVKKELEKQKEEQTPAPPQQTQSTKISTKTINRINRFASRFIRQSAPPVSDTFPQSAPESPSMEPPNPPQRPSSNRRQQVNPLRQRANNMAGNAAKKFGKKIAKQALKKIATSALANPYVLAAIGIILILVLVVVILISVFTGGPKDDKDKKIIPGLALQMSGQESVKNGENISYTIRVSYSGIGEIVIYDQIPQNTSFVSATGNYKNENNTISWALKENTPISPKISPLKVYSFDLIIHPEKRDIIVINKPTAKLIGYPMPDSTDFDKLMRGQGRINDKFRNMFKSEDDFVTKVMQNGLLAQYPLFGKDGLVRKIYKAAVEKNVNPLAVMATWGTEAGFGLNGTEFGCDPHRGRFPGFDNQVQCGANTWNNWMNYFEQNKKPDGTLDMASNIGKTCIYDDEFLYAAEWYGPICHAYDKNENFRRNFVKYYRAFAGM